MLILYRRNNIAFLFGTLPVGTVTGARGFPVCECICKEKVLNVVVDSELVLWSFFVLSLSLLIQMLLGC